MIQDQETIVSAIRRLGSEEMKERVDARGALEGMGTAATWHLIQAVHPRGDRTRLEALKILTTLEDETAADLFVELLEDEDSDCRWLAAKGLAALGELGVERVLDLLSEYPRTDRLARSLHHALTEVERGELSEVLAPVLSAFQGIAREARLPMAVYQARNELRKMQRSRSGRDAAASA